MMTSIKGHSDFFKTFFAAIVVCALFAVAAFSVILFLPRDGVAEPLEMVLIEEPQADEEIFISDDVPRAENVSWAEKDSFDAIRIQDWNAKDSTVDKGLELYRNPLTRAVVEWFYLRVTGRRDVTMAILEEANREDVPLSLAFALCYTESRYNCYARNVNKNGSIDRGLFQLNDRSFPRLGDDEFYSPETSAKYGLRHLRFCMNVAGDETLALAMYNAGLSRVRNNQTPSSTLRYVGSIASYRANLENAFSEEVLRQLEKNSQRIRPVVAR